MRKLDQLFKVLSDNTRLRLLSLLAHRPHCVCEFQSILQASQPTVSRHLAYLRRSGLVEVERHGKMIMYSLGKPEDPIQATLLRCVYACISEGGYFQHDVERSRATEPLIQQQGISRARRSVINSR
jgi:ArsR family transcriptional regulator, arsenate/arsenite/antimonite-responsive transcriptional repressor